MKLEKIKDLIGKIAPALGTALGGPLGGVAGTVISQALGVESEALAYEKLIADPNALLELKKAEIEFQKFLKEINVREEELVVQDRADARGMAKAMGSWAPQMVIVGTLTVLVGWAMYELFLEAPPKGSENVLYFLLGQLTTAWTAGISFFVGTTRSSADKTQALREIGSKSP